MRVFGIGSPFGDDQAGWLVADALAAFGEAEVGNAEIVKLDRPGAALLHALEGCEEAVLVDAVVSGAAPGTIHHLDRSSLERVAASLPCTHGFGVAHALRLGAVLGRLPPRLRLYGIEIDPGTPASTLSPEVAEAAVRLAAEILESLGARHETRAPRRKPVDHTIGPGRFK